MAVGGASIRQDFTVGFLSLSSDTSIEKFIAKIDDALIGQKCVFSKLTITDLQSFAPRNHDFDAVVLLHSILHGRNSITDVAGAKYSKLLQQLKAKYGPHRVGVIVHSMMSFNPDTKTVLMMIFKKSQPTTFKCSNCVIQCGQLAEMPEDDFARMVDFLADAPQYKLPTCDESLKKSPTPPKKESLSMDGLNICRDGPVASNDGANSSILLESSGISQRKEGLLEDIRNYEDDGRSNAYRGHAATTPLSEETRFGSVASTNKPYKTDVEPTYPVALIVLPNNRSLEAMQVSVKRTLPEKTIFSTKNIRDLNNSWHMFEAIFIDVGLPKSARHYQEHINECVVECRNKLRVRDNVALLMTNTTDDFPDDRARECLANEQEFWQSNIFLYDDVGAKNTVFVHGMVFSIREWMWDCYSRYTCALDVRPQLSLLQQAKERVSKTTDSVMKKTYLK